MIFNCLHRFTSAGLKCCFALLPLAAFALGVTEATAQVSFLSTEIEAMSQGLSAPAGVAMDGAGDLFLTDTGNNRVVMIAASGPNAGEPVTVLTGLSSPNGLAADWNGNVYIADTGNNRIVILPKVGNSFGAQINLTPGLSGPMSVAVDGQLNLYVADTGNNRGVMLPYLANSYGAAVQVATGLNHPEGVAVDGKENLYFADTGNNRVVEFRNSTSGYSSLTSLRTMNAPAGVSVDKNYNLYIADTGDNQVHELPWSTGAKRFSNPVYYSSDLSSPSDIVTDAAGDIYIADTANNRVVKIVAHAEEFGSYAVNGSPVLQTYNFQVAAGTTIGAVGIYTQGISGMDFVDAGSTTCTAQTYASAAICGVSVNFVAINPGLRSGAVTIFDGFGNAMATAFISGVGIAPQAIYIPATQSVVYNQLSGPSGVALDGNGDVYISDTGNNRVVEVPWSGTAYGAENVVPVANLQSPLGLSFDGGGNLYVVSNANDSVIKLLHSQNGFGAQTKVGTAMYGPWAVAAARNGVVYIANTLASELKAVPWNGVAYGQEYSIGNYHKYPESIAADALGNVYFSSPYVPEVMRIPWDGTRFTAQAPLPLIGLGASTGIVTDGNNNVYVLDGGRGQVLMLPWTGTAFGTQVTVASGFNAPSAIAIDAVGNLYVADTGNNQVVRIQLSAPPSVQFANTFIGSTSVDSPRAVTVLNAGTQPLLFASLSYATDFPESAGITNSCTGSITETEGSACEIPMSFTPQAVGSPLIESVTFTTNSFGQAGLTQSVAVSGTSLSRGGQTINFPAMASVTYGAGPIVLNASASSGLPVSYSVVSGPGILNAKGTMLSVTGAGAVTIAAQQAGNSAFGAAATVTQSLTIMPATLTVTPTNVTAVYGAIPSQFSYTVRGFIPGDNAGKVLSGSAAVNSQATGGASVGTYTLQASGGTLSAANYSFVFLPGVLTVTPASLVVSPAPANMIYGAALPAMSLTVSGLKNNDTIQLALSGKPQFQVPATSASIPGSYTISLAQGTLTSQNYQLKFAPSTLTISKRPLTIVMQPATKQYGQSVPNFAYSFTGFVNGDTASVVSGLPVFQTNASRTSAAGTYAVTVTPGRLGARCYSFVGGNGALTVTKGTLTVTAASLSFTYGESAPELTYSITGFQNGDTAASAISGSPIVSSAAGAHPAAGEYAVTIQAGTLASQNYAFVLIAGTIKVTPAALTVTAANVSMTEGTKLPALTYTYSGFVAGDTATSATKGAPALATLASSKSKPGSYAIIVADGNLRTKNYTLNLVNGKITVKSPS